MSFFEPWPQMAHYDIFRRQLAIKYPALGHALWDPNPINPDMVVQVGDVGFIREGRFHRLFNALLPGNDPSHYRGVPVDHEPLVPSLPDHIVRGTLSANNYCSAGVNIEDDPGRNFANPDDFHQLVFRHFRVRGAAVLSLPVAAGREDTLAQGDFGRWMVKHIDSWFAFGRSLGLWIEQMEDIVLVTGCDRTRSWTNIAFLGAEREEARVTFGVKVDDPGTGIHFQLLPGLVRGAMINQGPQGVNLPENQCVFIRGFRVARYFWTIPRRLKAAAGSPPDPGGYDYDPGTEVTSIPAVTKVKDSVRLFSAFSDLSKYWDPLHLLMDHIAEQASDCDMVLAHDDDLAMINGNGRGTLLETFEPDGMMDLLRRSNIRMHKVLCDLPPINSPSGLNSDTAVVKVAMLSMISHNWKTASPTLAVHNVDLGYTSELRGAPPPATPGSLRVQVSTIRGDTNNHDVPLLTEHGDSAPTTLQDLGDSAPLDGGHDAEDIVVSHDEIRSPPSSVWSSLRKFAYVERHRLGLVSSPTLGYMAPPPLSVLTDNLAETHITI